MSKTKKTYRNIRTQKQRKKLETEKNQKFLPKLIDNLYYFIFKRPSIAKQLLLWYLFFTFIGGVILWSPFTHAEGQTITFIDAIFTSASAISDTGLTVVDISAVFNFIGEFIIMVWIIIGGIGWFAIKIFIINFIFFRKMKYKSHEQAKERLGTTSTENTKGIIKVAVVSTIILILIFGPLFGIVFATQDPQMPEGMATAIATGQDWIFNSDGQITTLMTTEQAAATVPDLKGNWADSMWTGYFTAASAINNAGFDVMAGNSSIIAYYGNWGLQIAIMFLFVFGGIGFSIIYDILEWMKNKAFGQRFKFSVTTKVGLIAYWSIALFGVSIAMMSETITYFIDNTNSFWGATNGYGSLSDRVFAVFFNSMSTRNAGFSTIDYNLLSEGTKLSFSLLMFVGSGPGSTAGGIRTTTAAVVLLSLWSFMRGKRETVIANRKIADDQIKESFAIVIFSAIVVFMLVLVLTIGEKNTTIGIGDSIFLACSAFGTTGLSTIDLSTLNTSSKISLLIVMFIGQLGAATTIKQFRRNKLEKSLLFHVEERISLG